MKKISLFGIGIAMAGVVTAAYAYSVVDSYDHGATVQYDILCDSGSKRVITYYKKTGEYCTPSMSCNINQSKVARWACS